MTLISEILAKICLLNFFGGPMSHVGVQIAANIESVAAMDNSVHISVRAVTIT